MTFLSLLLAIPWWAVMTIQISVPLLVVSFAVQSEFWKSESYEAFC